jgi:uncharacterized protein YndB with AHSA1/START domain
MAEWFVEGYVTTPVTVRVFAETAEEARDIGKDLLADGKGVEASPLLSPELMVYTDTWQEAVFPESQLF